MDAQQALKSATHTKILESSEGAIERVAGVFQKLFPGKKAAMVADRNTFRAAGERVAAELRSAGILSRTWIFEQEEFHADYELVEAVRDFLKSRENEIAVAVGGGTINDICKLASELIDRPYLCVATAASVDGYASFGASITRNGSKKNIGCRAPAGIVADPDVVGKAPREMTASGYADLSAKIISGADWIVADFLGAEKIDATSWDIVQGGLKSALADPSGAREGRKEAIIPLSEGLMLGGFAMQYIKSSRPASGSEHQFSHLWDMENLTYEGRYPSHGFKVGVGTLCMTAMCEEFLREDFSKLDLDLLCSSWGTLEDRLEEVEELLKGEAFLEFAKREVSAKYISPDKLKIQLGLLKCHSDILKEKVRRQIIPYGELRNRLSLVGAPVSSMDFGVDRARLERSFFRAQKIRDRFTMLDLAFRSGMLEKWVRSVLEKHPELYS